MPIKVFEGFIEDVEADRMFVRFVDIDTPLEEMEAEIDTEFVCRRDKKYIMPGFVFRLYVRPEGDKKEPKSILRFKKKKPLTKEEWAEIEEEAEELRKLLRL